MLKDDCQINNNFLKLYKKFCPGPITFVLKLKKIVKFLKMLQTTKKHWQLDFQNIHYTRKLLKILNIHLQHLVPIFQKDLVQFLKKMLKMNLKKN